MKQALWIGLLIIVALGCGKQQPQEIVKGPTGGGNLNQGTPNTDDKITNQTETSICAQPMPGKPSVMGSWSVDLVIKGVSVHQTWTFSPGKVRNRAVCHPEGLSLVAEAQSPAEFPGSQIRIFQSGQGTTQDGKYVCSVQVTGKTIMSYTFKGPCLKLSGYPDNYLWIPENLNEENLKDQNEETTWEN